MTRRLGEYIFRGRPQAIGITSLFTVCALIVPLFTYQFSGIVPALVTLRKGPAPGLQVITGSLLLTLVVTLLAGVNPYLMLLFALGIWAPVWFCAVILRMTEDHGRMLLATGLCGLAYIALSHMLLDDVTQWWKSVLELWVVQVLPPESAGKYAGQLVAMAPWMNAAITAGLAISLATTLFIARWWQASMFQPGGFGREFQALLLPKALTIVLIACVAVLAAGLADTGSPVLEALVLIVFLYVFQGLASIHRLAAAGRLAKSWLIAIYVLLAVLPQAVLFIACMGIVDSWMYRARAANTHDKS